MSQPIHRFILALTLIILAILLLTIYPTWQFNSDIHPIPDDTFSETLSKDDEAFDRVLKPRKFSFPKDFGAHDRYRIEWWYFTGNLSTAAHRKFGYELTFFRFALSPEKFISQSTWRSNQLYMAHFAVTDAAENHFHVQERYSREANGLAGANADQYHVWLYDWSATSINQAGFPIRLRAGNDDYGIDLRLDAIKPLLLQGQQGYSPKSDKPGNASYYYSYTRLATTGHIRINQRQIPVSGSSWMDREWSTSALSPEQKGWDWFALQLDDNSELMFYQFRRKDGLQDDNSSGVLYLADYTEIPLDVTNVTINVLDNWQSPHSGVTYPARWHLSIPSRELELDITPLINDQELTVRYRYWEGAVAISGTKQGKPIFGQGYVELTGYNTD
jgi:predicted secreted hydrolase